MVCLLVISYNLKLPKRWYDIIGEAAKATNKLFHIIKQDTLVISNIKHLSWQNVLLVLWHKHFGDFANNFIMRHNEFAQHWLFDTIRSASFPDVNYLI